jgi:hypothetical protein
MTASFGFVAEFVPSEVVLTRDPPAPPPEYETHTSWPHLIHGRAFAARCNLVRGVGENWSSTTTGRRIHGVAWRPAVIGDDLREPLRGSAATGAFHGWNAARGCTNVIATRITETSPSAVARGAT